MSRYLSEEEISILKHEFDQYDTDKGGNITIEEFGRVMKASGQNPTEEELAQIIREVDLDGDGTINFDEFIAMMTGRSRAPPPAAAPSQDNVLPTPTVTLNGDAAEEEDAELKKAWSEFDHSAGKGSVTPSQFRQIIAGLGETVTDAEVEGVLNSVDGEGKVSYRQFIEFIKARQVSEDDIIDGYGA